MSVDIRIQHKLVRIIAVYFPHAGYSWQNFSGTIDDVTALCIDAQSQDAALLVGGYFNLSLNYGDRAAALGDLCNQFQLQITNADGVDHHEYNETFRSSLGSP